MLDQIIIPKSAHGSHPFHVGSGVILHCTFATQALGRCSVGLRYTWWGEVNSSRQGFRFKIFFCFH